MSIRHSIHQLGLLCDTIPAKLRCLSSEDFNEKVGSIWTKKQVLGHLIDSAVNNHQRFIRTQFEERPQIAYDQDKWNALNHYEAIDEQLLIQLWETYNRFLCEVLEKIPSENLMKICIVKGKKYSLQFIVDDYLAHMEYHLHQLVAF